MRKLESFIERTKSHLCVGIDPSWTEQSYFMDEVRKHGAKEFLISWSEIILDAAKDLVPAVKFQSAFFEQFGAPGFAALEASIAKAREKNFFVILDAKRGDISSTMKAYGTTAFEKMGADALTITPYMGVDVIEAIQNWLLKGKYAYLVWITSNSSASVLQDSQTSGGTFAELVHATFKAHASKNGFSQQLGFVYGATKMDAMKNKLHNELLLIPGIGAQGGQIDAKLKQLLSDNPLSLYNVSRGITEIAGAQKFDRDQYHKHCVEKITSFK